MMLIGADWCWLLLIDADWCWLILIDALIDGDRFCLMLIYADRCQRVTVSWSGPKSLEHPFLNLSQMQYLSFCHTCAADCQRTRPLSIWPIIEPPSKAAIEHFLGAHCDPHPLHVPCLNKRSGNYILWILPSSPSGSLVVSLAVVGSSTKLPWWQKGFEDFARVH